MAWIAGLLVLVYIMVDVPSSYTSVTTRTAVVHTTDSTVSTTIDVVRQRHCGNHGSWLVDHCICDFGYEGQQFCNHTSSSTIFRNAKCRFDPNQDVCWNIRGIGRFRVSSSRQRQQEAFSCETKFWETTSIPKRNQDQLLVFDYFRALLPSLGDVLEIGAGPYTKTKLILENRPNLSIQSVTLVDPLLNEYQSNPSIQTSYASGSLQVVTKGGRDSNITTIPTTLVQGQGEDPLTPAHYDTIILVNTLEHCSNAVTVLNNVYHALKPGGILIFAESFAREMELLQSDPCHPIQLQKSFFMDYLNNHFYTSRDDNILLAPRTGDLVDGVQHGGVKRSIFAIVQK